MSRLHICNTFFEKELEKGGTLPLSAWIRAHPIVLQLQFLPLLYAAPDDRILVSDLPANPDPRLCLIDNPPPLPIEHWGPSLAISAWAKEHHLPYKIPDWDLIRKINSKVFSFTESPKLPGAELLETPEEVKAWLAKTSGPKVLKTPFGTAGNGHRFEGTLNAERGRGAVFGGPERNVKQQYNTPKTGAVSGGPGSNVKRQYNTPKTEAVFGGPESNVKRLYIGEPWVERVMDFSTQWLEGKLVGVTVFENEVNGTYKGTFAGKVEDWALEEHLEVAKPLVEKVMKMGYAEHLGIDAFIYMWEGKKRLHPVVEINARKTMSWVSLQMKEKQLWYGKREKGILPTELNVRGKMIRFARNVIS